MTTARELTNRLADLLREERGAMADLLVALADFDRKHLWRDLGHASLFSFLRRELGLSAGAAQYRKTAAELVQRFPEVEAALRAGRLCLSSVIELAKVLTPENAAEVLPRFFGLSSRDAAAVAVSIRPREDPPLRDIVTPVRPPAPAPPAAEPPLPPAVTGEAPALLLRAPEVASASAACVRVPAPTARATEPIRSSIEPLTADLSRLHVTVSRRFLEKLDAARDALSHSNPGATMEEILEAGLDLLLERASKRKGIVEKPRKEPPPSSPESDHIPAHVKRAVWLRDGGRCQWRMEDGSVCGSTFRVEFDHIHPQALGGPSTVENVRVACRSHNQLAARRAFGNHVMDRYARNGRARKQPAPAATRPPHPGPLPRLMPGEREMS